MQPTLLASSLKSLAFATVLTITCIALNPSSAQEDELLKTSQESTDNGQAQEIRLGKSVGQTKSEENAETAKTVANAETEKPVENVEAGDHAAQAETAKDGEQAQPVEVADASEPAAQAEDAKDTEAAKPVEVAEASEPAAQAEAAKDTEPTHPVKGAEADEPAAQTETAKNEEQAQPVEGAEANEPAAQTGTAKNEEQAQPVEDAEADEPAAQTEATQDVAPAKLVEKAETSEQNEGDLQAIATTSSDPQEVPDFSMALDLLITQMQQPNNAQPLAAFITSDPTKQQSLLSKLNQLFKDPALKPALQQLLPPLLAKSSYDLQNTDELNAAVKDTTPVAVIHLMCKGLNRLNDKQIQTAVFSLLHTMSKWDAAYLTQAIQSPNTNNQTRINYLMQAMAPQDFHDLIEVLAKAIQAEISDSPEAIIIPENHKQTAISAFLVTFSKWTQEHQAAIDKLKSLLTNDDNEAAPAPAMDDVAQLVQSFVDLATGHTKSTYKDDVLLRKALVQSLAETAASEEGLASLFDRPQED